jgi:hypothetical protein
MQARKARTMTFLSQFTHKAYPFNTRSEKDMRWAILLNEQIPTFVRIK